MTCSLQPHVKTVFLKKLANNDMFITSHKPGVKMHAWCTVPSVTHTICISVHLQSQYICNGTSCMQGLLCSWGNSRKLESDDTCTASVGPHRMGEQGPTQWVGLVPKHHGSSSLWYPSPATSINASAFHTSATHASAAYAMAAAASAPAPTPNESTTCCSAAGA